MLYSCSQDRSRSRSLAWVTASWVTARLRNSERDLPRLSLQVRILCRYGNRQGLQPILSANPGRPVLQNAVHKVPDFCYVSIRKCR